MVVSQSDWIPTSTSHTTIWNRLSMFLIVLILLLLILMAVQEYLQLNLIESFSQCMFDSTVSSNNTSSGGFPLRCIIPQEYIQPKITMEDIQNKRVTMESSVSTRNRFLQAILQNNVKLPILSSVTEKVALEDVEKTKNSCTITSAVTLHAYLKEHPTSKLSVLDVIDSIYIYILVSSKSDIFDIRDLKQKTIMCGVSGTASNSFVHILSKSLGWKQNKDFIVNESTPNPELVRRLMIDSRNPQVDAVVIADVYPSSIVQSIIRDSSNDWRIIRIPNSPSQYWNPNVISYSMLNQKSNTSQINTIMTPLVMVSNSNYNSDELLKFTSHAKNPFILYDLK